MKKELTKGLQWTSIQQMGIMVIGVLKLMILTRLLDKEDFGIFAIVMLIVGFTNIFSDLGISTSLYHKKNITQVQYSTLYFLNMLMSIVLYGLIILSTPLLILYFKNEELHSYIAIIALNLIFMALGNHFKIYAEKKMWFRSIAIILISSNVIGLIVAILLAYFKYGVLSLIWSTLTVSIVNSLSFYFLMRKIYPIKFVFRFNEVTDFFKVGLFQSGSQVLDYICNQIDIIVIGGLLSTELLGAYNLIKQLATYAYSLMSTVLNKVAVPIFSSFNDDESLLKERYLKIIESVSLVNAIIYSSIAILGKELITILYGQSYASFSWVLLFFCLIYFFSSIISPASILVLSKGKTKEAFFWTTYRIVIYISLVVILGNLYKLPGILFASLLFAVQSLYTYWYFVIRKVQSNITKYDHLHSFQMNTAICLGILACYYLFSTLCPLPISIFISMIIKMLILIILITSFLYIFRKNQLLLAIEYVTSKLKKT